MRARMCRCLLRTQVNRSPGAGVRGSSEYLMWVIEINSGPLEEQYTFLTESHFSSPCYFLSIGRGLGFFVQVILLDHSGVLFV